MWCLKIHILSSLELFDSSEAEVLPSKDGKRAKLIDVLKKKGAGIMSAL